MRRKELLLAWASNEKKYHKNAINIVIIELVTSGAFQPERNECQISERVGLL